MTSMMRFKYQSSILVLLVAALLRPAFLNAQGVDVQHGVIADALYTVASPVNWNGKLLIFAHGLRPDTEPLRADLNIERPLYKTLLDEGWMIATSSYRRNGIIIEDAIEDLGLLCKHIIETYDRPTRLVVMGDSMGGIIGTLIAEKHAEDYDAILAAGAALGADQATRLVGLNFDPKIPIVFLTNRSEIEGPEHYVGLAADGTIPPALWRVDRDGHVNVNDQERLAALRALEHFPSSGELDRAKDGTIAIAANSTARFFENSAEGEIAGTTESHGNIFTSLVPEDLQQLGIKTGDHFNLTIREYTARVLLGSNYSEVSRGEWIGIMRAEGVLMVARNRSNACETAACQVGDKVTITQAD